MKQLICIGCPRGCHLSVDEEHDFAVTGNHCPIGARYGASEMRYPTRILTTTVKVVGGIHASLPVKTDRPIGKELLFAAMKVADGITVAAPVRCGQVIVKDLLATGADLVASRDMAKAEETA
jgi:CxxC motif-containing protein